MEGGSLTAAEGPLFQVELDARIVLKHTAIAVPSGQLLKLYRGFSPPGNPALAALRAVRLRSASRRRSDRRPV